MSHSPNRANARPSFHAAFDVFIAANRKGGIGKTTLILFLVALALMREARVRVFEIDKQNRLEKMYPKIVTQIDMPGPQQLIDDDTIESRTLAKVYSALRSPKNEGLVFVDIGANYDERFAQGLLRSRMSKGMAAAGRSACVLVPLDGLADTITAAASVVVQFRTALPEAQFVFVQRHAQINFDLGVNRRGTLTPYRHPILALTQF